MYQFLTGPMLWLSFAVFFIGLAVRVVRYIKGLNWQMDRVPYGYYTELGVKGALKSIVYWVLPYGSRSWREKPIFATLFFLFHIGLVILPVFLFAHVMIFNERFGISWPTFSAPVADTLTILAIAAALGILIRRMALPEVRIITTPQDILVLTISVLPLITGFIAAHSGPDGEFWTLAHIVTGEVWLIAVPLTKLAHVALFFCSRAQLGMDYGIKRGGMKGRGIAW